MSLKVSVTAFAEALNFCLKDGLNATRDYRALAGLFPVLRVATSSIRKVLDSFAGYGQIIPVITARLFSHTLSHARLSVQISHLVSFLWRLHCEIPLDKSARFSYKDTGNDLYDFLSTATCHGA